MNLVQGRKLITDDLFQKQECLVKRNIKQQIQYLFITSERM